MTLPHGNLGFWKMGEVVVALRGDLLFFRLIRPLSSSLFNYCKVGGFLSPSVSWVKQMHR